MAASASRKFGAEARCSEPLGELSAVALAETGDQRFLAVEIDVERAGADARLAADRVHRRRVKAAAREARKRRVENVLAPGALRIWFKFRHLRRRPENELVMKTERAFCLSEDCGEVKANSCSFCKSVCSPGNSRKPGRNAGRRLFASVCFYKKIRAVTGNAG